MMLTMSSRRHALVGAVALAMAVATGSSMSAQRGGGAPQPPQTPQAGAPIDLTGYWVSIVNEDWRWRMVTPPKGDFASVPLNREGTQVGNTWDASKDGSCLAYGAAGLMRMPTRLHITWENEATLKVETDAGTQTRRLIFNQPPQPQVQKSLQGISRAEWERFGGGRGVPGGGNVGPITTPRSGSLKVITTNLSGGWLRRNGAPYSDTTTMTEFFDRFPAPDGNEWLVVTTIVSDPKYLTQDFVTSTHFRKERDGAKWDPTACRS